MVRGSYISIINLYKHLTISGPGESLFGTLRSQVIKPPRLSLTNLNRKIISYINIFIILLL